MKTDDLSICRQIVPLLTAVYVFGRSASANHRSELYQNFIYLAICLANVCL